ncbi:BamA/OMP85 family outer membrane protein [Maribellus mangrovi]|uniref:BamA/OMP85 family outer membrane protein n=1 Tax=Maribellus mangrovi TaxID=3133146 RepID=UPI0030EBDC6B
MKPVFLFIVVLIIALSVSGQEGLIIGKISFEGNKSIKASPLRDQMIMESNSWFKEKIMGKQPVIYTQSLYNQDINRLRIFYQMEGFLDVKFLAPNVKVNEKNKVELIVRIQEHEPVIISGITFEVDSALQLEKALLPREVRKMQLQMESEAEKIFRDESVNYDRRVISEVFYNRGYPYAKVESGLKVDTTENTAEINWNIDRGPLSYFGKTLVRGNERVPDKSILRQVNYEEGDLWSKKKIDQAQEQIYNQGNYRVASVRTELQANKQDTLPITITVREAPRWTTRFGVGYGREDKFRAYTDLQYLSFLTNTGRLNLFAKHSGLEPYNIYLKFSQPSFLFYFNTLTLNPYLLRQNEPGFQLDKRGFTVTFLQNFSKALSTSIGYIFEDVDNYTIHTTDSKDQTADETYYSKSGFSVGLVYNNSEPILDPVHGYVISMNTKTNDLFGQTEMPFVRVITEFKTYAGITRGVIMAMKVKMGGIVRTDEYDYIPPEERFFAGGSYSVRGWARSELGPKDELGIPVGGNSLLEGSAELRIDIGRKFKVSLFTDAGNVWENSFSYHLNDLHYSSGVGFHYKTPIGPAGLEFARPVFDSLTKWQIHFNIGHTF